jgi:SAM-dependent methyltransferase
MKVSSNDLYINGGYLKNNPTWNTEDSEWKATVITNLLQNNKVDVTDVVEIGCGAGENLVQLSKKNKGILLLRGYDISPQAIELAQKKATDKISFFKEDITGNEDFHTALMLVIDVVEHVDDFYGFLRKLKAKSTYFVFHIPLDLSCRTILKPHILLQQRKDVGHIHYFTKEMVEWALTDAGYQITDWVYTKPVVDVKPADSVKRFVKKILRNVSFALSKNWSAKKWGGYSIMILAK